MNPAIRSTQANVLRSMIRTVILYRKHIHPLRWASVDIPTEQIWRTYHVQTERWLEAKAVGLSVFRHIHAPAYAAGAAAFLICDHGHSKQDMLQFMKQLSTGELAKDNPLCSLRRIMSTYAIHKGSADYEPLAFMLRGWNLHLASARVDVISWKPEDGMPRIASQP